MNSRVGSIKGRIYQAGFVLALCASFAQNSQAGAWLQDKGHGLIISGISLNQAEQAYDSTGKLGPIVDFKKQDSFFYLEYGLSDKITLVGNSSIQDVSYIATKGPQHYRGFATSKIGLRYGIKTKSNWHLALQPSLVIPAGGEAIPDGDLGLGGFGGELRGLAGHAFSVGNKPGFFNIESAYDLRSGGAPRQVSTDITLAIRPAPKFELMGQGFYRHTNASAIEGDTILANESFKLQGSVAYSFTPKTSVQLGYFQAVSGKNIVREQGGTLALWTKF